MAFASTNLEAMANVDDLYDMKMKQLVSLIELSASCEFPSHDKEPEAIVSNLKWFKLHITLHLKGKPTQIVRNSVRLPLRLRLVSESGIPITLPDSQTGFPIRIRGNLNNDLVYKSFFLIRV